MKYVPIGSVMKAGKSKAMILGYHVHTDPEKDCIEFSYIMCGYPMGVTGAESLKIVPVDAKMELVEEGYHNEDYDHFIKNKQELYDLTNGMTLTQINQEIQETEQKVRKAVEENANHG